MLVVTGSLFMKASSRPFNRKKENIRLASEIFYPLLIYLSIIHVVVRTLASKKGRHEFYPFHMVSFQDVQPKHLD